MTISGATARPRLAADDRQCGIARRARRQLASVAWFAGLSLGLAVLAFAAGTPAAMLPFILAIGPLLIALVIAWREGDGAVRTLLHSATIRPADRRWYLVLLIPVFWSLATVGVAVGLGEPVAGLFASLFPAVLIVPIVVLVPAFTEELAWRGFALPRLMSAMSPLQAALLRCRSVGAPPRIPVRARPVQRHTGGVAMVVNIFAYSIVLTWVYIGTGGSVLLTALLHAALNGVAPVMGGVDPDNAWAIRNVLAAVIAVAVVALGGLRRPAVAEPVS